MHYPRSWKRALCHVGPRPTDDRSIQTRKCLFRLFVAALTDLPSVDLCVGFNLLLHRVLDSHCQIDSSQCLAQLTPARVGIARSVHVQLGASPHVIRWDMVCLSPQWHTSICDSFHILFIIARQRPFCTLSRFKLLQVDQGSSVPLAKCSFGIIPEPLSRHSIDLSTPVPTMWYEHLICFCWVKKAVSGGFNESRSSRWMPFQRLRTHMVSKLETWCAIGLWIEANNYRWYRLIYHFFITIIITEMSNH